MSDDTYGSVATLTFIGTYIYCIAHYGLLLGVGLGWLPAMIIAVVWPLSLPVAALVAFFT